jgi:hypothetical protein
MLAQQTDQRTFRDPRSEKRPMSSDRRVPILNRTNVMMMQNLLRYKFRAIPGYAGGAEIGAMSGPSFTTAFRHHPN